MFVVNFLSTLAFPKRLAKIEKLDKLVSDQVDVQTTVESIQENQSIPTPKALLTLSLPRIVVIGDEKAGKSSTLERIAYAEVLPRDVGICTRQPIVMRLRHDPNVSQTIFKLDIPGFYTQGEEVLDASSVREHITRRMKEIATNKQGIIMDSEIEVQITSKDVPTIDLVDLPGLIAVMTINSSEPDDLAQKTEQCTRKYLDAESTGMIVCVLDAAQDNLKASKAIRMVQESRQELQQNTIGVLAKADRCHDLNWEEIGQKGPMWQLEERLLGEAEDVKAIALKSGYIAVKNRNTRTLTTIDLPTHNISEAEWFQKNMRSDSKFLDPDGTLSEFGKYHLGLQALIGKIDMIICRHLEKEWVPGKLLTYKQKREELEAHMLTLGTSPSDLNLDVIFLHAHNRLKEALKPEWIDQLCKEAIASLKLPEDMETTTVFEQMAQEETFFEMATASISNGTLVSTVQKSFLEKIKSCCDSDTTGEIQLCRFPTLNDTICESVECYFKKGESLFLKQTESGLSFIELVPSTKKKREQIEGILIQNLMRNLFVPMLKVTSTNLFSVLHDTKQTLSEVPQENNDRIVDRTSCAKKLENIIAIEETLKHLSS